MDSEVDVISAQVSKLSMHAGDRRAVFRFAIQLFGFTSFCSFYIVHFVHFLARQYFNA